MRDRAWTIGRIESPEGMALWWVWFHYTICKELQIVYDPIMFDSELEAYMFADLMWRAALDQ